MLSRCAIIALAIFAGLGCSSSGSISGSRAAQPAETVEQGTNRTWHRGPDIEIEEGRAKVSFALGMTQD